MKKNIWKIIIATFFTLTILLISYSAILISGGYSKLNNIENKQTLNTENQHVNNDLENKIIEEQGPLIQKYIKYNFDDINKVTFTHVTVSPMNIPTVRGYVNNNQKESFRATIYKNKFDRSLNFDTLELQNKYPRKSPEISLEDIEKIEQKNN